MFRTFALVVALVAAFGAFGYAQNLHGYQALNVKNPRAAAGQVNADGTIAQGTHFTVRYIQKGEYELTFNERYFSGGCPILTISGISTANTDVIYPKLCNVYDVYFFDANKHIADTEFDLVAVAAQ